MKKFISSILVVMLGLFIGISLGSKSAVATEPSDPIVVQVKSPKEVPPGATVETTVKRDCATITTWKLVEPGKDAVYKTEYRYLREVPAQEESSHHEWNLEHRTRTLHPAEEEISHKEYLYERTVKHCEPTTEYQWEKWVKGTKEVKKDGKWVSDGDFDYRDYPGAGPVWADGGSGPHNSTWIDSDTRYHSTHYKYVKTGVTREGKPVCTTKQESSGWVKEKPEGDGWELKDTKTVVDKEAVPASYSDWSEWSVQSGPFKEKPTAPENTETEQFRVSDPIKVVDQEATDGYTEYYVKGGDPTRTREDASWVAAEVLEGWTRFDEQKTLVEAAVPAKVTLYVYDDKQECSPTPTPTPTPDQPSTPGTPSDTPEPPAPPATNTPTPDKPSESNPPKKNVEPPASSAPPAKFTPPDDGLAQTGADAWIGFGALLAVAAIVTGAVLLANPKKD